MTSPLNKKIIMKLITSQISLLVIISSFLWLTVTSVKIIVEPFSKISKLDSLPRNSIGDGIVPETRSCGGSGELIQWRYESCRYEDNPCHVPADEGLRRAEVDIVASKNIDSVGLRFIVKSLDGEVSHDYIYDKPIFNSVVRKDELYTISNVGGVTKELKGKKAIFQYIVYDKFSNDIEICAEADLQYV